MGQSKWEQGSVEALVERDRATRARMLRAPILAREAPSHVRYRIEFGIKLYLQKGLHFDKNHFKTTDPV